MDKIKPIWELKKPRIMDPWDFESKFRFIIKNSIPIESILSRLDSSYLRQKFTSHCLENPELDKKRIKGILERWSNNLPVDPPILMWGDKNWQIEDGIHRINCAISLGALKIPLIFNRVESPIWESYINNNKN